MSIATYVFSKPTLSRSIKKDNADLFLYRNNPLEIISYSVSLLLPVVLT